MKKRTLGRTGLEVSQSGFGAIKLPEEDEETCAEALNAALDLGINFIDTARNYKDSEAKIGRAVSHRRAEFYLATKSYARTRSDLRRELETSLAELRTDYLDLYQLHSVSNEDAWRQVTAPDGALAEVRRAQDEGLVRHVGITIHRHLGVMEKAVRSGEFETVMLCYSVLDTEHVGPDILPLVQESGLGLIVMKSLSGGMLVSQGFEEGRRAGEEDPLVTACLRYVLSHPAVSCVIPGMRNVHEVRQNVRVGETFVPMTPEEKADLIRRIGEKRGAFRYGQVCLQCGYCQPCPQGINIPAVFRAQMVVESYPDDLKALGYDTYDALAVKPDACEACGECVAKCPAGLDIPERLKEAVRLLEAR